MNCQNFESIVNELARQQMIEAGARDQALAHAEQCGECTLRLGDERALTQSLRDLTTDMSGLEAPARVESELLAAFRRQTVSGPLAFKAQSPKRNWSYWATAVAAAILLAVIVGIATMSMRPRATEVAAESPYIPPFRPGVANNIEAGPPSTGGEKVLTLLPKQGTKLSNHNPRRRTNSQGARPNSRDSRANRDPLEVNSDSTVAANYGNEIATDFMPVGYASPLSLQDGGQVMRVELPRSALAGFGLPVNMDRVNERVKADVLVGTDGQARAIRFVQ